MGKIKWNRPSGVPIETNDLDATVAYAARLGWERAEADTHNGDPVVTDPEPPVKGWDDPDTQPEPGGDQFVAPPKKTPGAPKANAKRGRKTKKAG